MLNVDNPVLVSIKNSNKHDGYLFRNCFIMHQLGNSLNFMVSIDQKLRHQGKKAKQHLTLQLVIPENIKHLDSYLKNQGFDWQKPFLWRWASVPNSITADTKRWSKLLVKIWKKFLLQQWHHQLRKIHIRTILAPQMIPSQVSICLYLYETYWLQHNQC